MPSASGSLSQEQLIALTEEIAALARAGVPLDAGLLRLAEDLPRRLRTAATELGVRLESGESLTRITAELRRIFPGYYSAAIEAGARSGRLAVALEGLAGTARRIAELRRMTAMALLYPMIVLMLVYALSVVGLVTLIPRLHSAYHFFEVQPWIGLDGLVWLGRYAHLWAAWPPLIALLVLGSLWWRKGHTRIVWRGSRARTWRNWPSIGNIVRTSRAAAFAQVLSLLVEHGVPLDEALELAGEASGDARLHAAGIELAGRLRRGQSLLPEHGVRWELPPLLQWLLASAHQGPQFRVALRQTADSYNRRAVRLSQRLTVAAPFWFGVGVSGVAVAGYALLFFAPWCRLMWEMAKP